MRPPKRRGPWDNYSKSDHILEDSAAMCYGCDGIFNDQICCRLYL